jgi:feruloyl esterase
MKTVFLSPLLGLVRIFASAQQIVSNPAAACQKLGASLAIENVKVNFAEYLPAGTNITLTQAYNLSTCGYTSQVISNDLCRVAMYVATSYRSGE